MQQKLPAIVFILLVFGLLVLNRFDFSQQVEAKVYRDTGTTYSVGQTFRRGEIVHTASGEFVELYISSLVQVNLDENTNLDLKSLSKNHVRVGFGHGRILVNVNKNESGNLEVDTPTAQHKIIGRTSFIGYDFKHETSVIPLSGSIQTTIPLLNQTFEVASPITIHDVNPPTVENITFDEKTDTRAAFYLWTENR